MAARFCRGQAALPRSALRSGAGLGWPHCVRVAALGAGVSGNPFSALRFSSAAQSSLLNQFHGKLLRAVCVESGLPRKGQWEQMAMACPGAEWPGSRRLRGPESAPARPCPVLHLRTACAESSGKDSQALDPRTRRKVTRKVTRHLCHFGAVGGAVPGAGRAGEVDAGGEAEAWVQLLPAEAPAAGPGRGGGGGGGVKGPAAPSRQRQRWSASRRRGAALGEGQRCAHGVQPRPHDGGWRTAAASGSLQQGTVTPGWCPRRQVPRVGQERYPSATSVPPGATASSETSRSRQCSAPPQPGLRPGPLCGEAVISDPPGP